MAENLRKNSPLRAVANLANQKTKAGQRFSTILTAQDCCFAIERIDLLSTTLVAVIKNTFGQTFTSGAGFLVGPGNATIVVVIIHKIKNRFHFRVAFEVKSGHRLRGTSVFRMPCFLGSQFGDCLLYTSPSPRDGLLSRMPSSA